MRRPGRPPARHGLRFRADRVSGAFTAKTLAAAKAGVRLTATHGALAAFRERLPGNADTRNPDEAVAAGAGPGLLLVVEAVAQRCRRFEARGRRWVRRRDRVVVGSAVTVWGPGSGRQDGELVAVSLAEVVGRHQQSPLEAHLDPASSVEATDAAVVLGVAEQGLDGLFAFSIPVVAVL